MNGRTYDLTGSDSSSTSTPTRRRPTGPFSTLDGFITPGRKLPEGKPIVAGEIESLLRQIDDGKELRVLCQLAGRGIERTLGLEVLTYLARRKLPYWRNDAWLEWADIWDELGLRDLRARYLVQGLDWKQASGGQEGVAILHLCAKPAEHRTPGTTRYLCKGNDDFSRWAWPTRADRNWVAPLWRNPAAVRGTAGSGLIPVCSRCAARAQTSGLFGRERNREMTRELAETLESLWLDQSDLELLDRQAAPRMAQALWNDIEESRRSSNWPYDPDVSDDGYDHSMRYALSGEPLSMRVRKMAKDALRVTYAARTAQEYDLQGDSALDRLLTRSEQDRLRAWEGQDAMQLVDLIDADLMYALSYWYESRYGMYLLHPGPNSRPIGEQLAAQVRARAKLPQRELDEFVCRAVAERERAEQAAELSADRAYDRAVLLDRIGIPAQG